MNKQMNLYQLTTGWEPLIGPDKAVYVLYFILFVYARLLNSLFWMGVTYINNEVGDAWPTFILQA